MTHPRDPDWQSRFQLQADALGSLLPLHRYWRAFPMESLCQFSVLFAATLAVSASCLAISASAKSPERASLLAIYLVGLQLPLSGAVLALPDMVSWITRPFIAAYWGWSGYIKSFASFRHYDIVKQSTDTYIANVELCLLVLGLHIVVAAIFCWYFIANLKND